jgi:hypothetical protein
VTPEVGGAKGTAGSVVPGLSDEPGDGIDRGGLGAEGVFEVFTGDVCALGYVVGSCDGGLLCGGTQQVAHESFGTSYVQAPWFVAVPLVSGGREVLAALHAGLSCRGIGALRGTSRGSVSVMASLVSVGDIGQGQSLFRAASDPANEAGRQLRRVLHARVPRLLRDQLWAAWRRHGLGGGILRQSPWRAAALSSMGHLNGPLWSARDSRLVSVPVVPGLIQGWCYSARGCEIR